MSDRRVQSEIDFQQQITEASLKFAAEVLVLLYPTEIDQLAGCIADRDIGAVTRMLLETSARSSSTRPNEDKIRENAADEMWPSEAARFLGIEKDKLCYHADRGRIPHTRSFGGVRVFSRRILEEIKPRIHEIIGGKK